MRVWPFLISRLSKLSVHPPTVSFGGYQLTRTALRDPSLGGLFVKNIELEASEMDCSPPTPTGRNHKVPLTDQAMSVKKDSPVNVEFTNAPLVTI
jgi:hypothetical protein